MPAPLILLVEDKASLRTMLRRALEAQGHRVVEAPDAPDGERHLRECRPALVLTDLRLPHGDGRALLRLALEIDPQLPVIVMTAYGTIEEAVAAMKEGAFDFLAKPVDPDHLVLLVERALAQRRILSEYLVLKEESTTRFGLPQVVGEHPALQAVIESLQRAAATDATVLLEGESGTGKELFARALHRLSPRTDGPFVAINCAAIPEALLESELFGHEKGAFTGAAGRKLGKFELAHRGTMFLDEIGELPLGLQAKLLRAIEEHRFERVGGNTAIEVDARFVTASNRELRAAVAERAFREDLYFRISVFPITIPPLRRRASDIPRLARHFVDRFCREMKKPPLAISDAAERELREYLWPGNVRELQNCIERAVILCDGATIQPRDLHLPFKAQPAAIEGPELDLSGSLADVSHRAAASAERRKILRALEEAGGNRARAADLLQVSHKTLLSKLREYGLA